MHLNESLLCCSIVGNIIKSKEKPEKHQENLSTNDGVVELFVNNVSTKRSIEVAMEVLWRHILANDEVEPTDKTLLTDRLLKEMHLINERTFNIWKQHSKAASQDLLSEVLTAFHVAGKMSLYEITNFLYSNRTQLGSCTNIIKTVCFLLKEDNCGYMQFYTTEDRHWFACKRAILKEFIQEFKTEKMENFEVFSFLHDCAVLLDENNLANDLKKILKKAKRIRARNSQTKVFSACETNCERDGSIYDRNRDPPGQRCVYIPPGDPNKETYRLSTYMRFPQNVPVNPKDLAAAGFFFTGYKDRVKCFSCAICVENWAVGDDVREPRWHKADCLMMNGGDSGNVPIGGFFTRWGNTSAAGAQTQPQKPATNPSSATPPQPQSVPAGVLLSKELGGQSNVRQTARVTQSASSQSSRTIRFQLANISSVHHEQLIRSLELNKESDRLKTFNHWPSENRSVRPTDLARSGFFYLGNLDRVQCYCCGGVLRNWQYGDVVEAEHKRLFPHCKKVLGTDTSNIPLTTPAPASQGPQEPRVPTETELRDLQSMFPCMYPVSPHMQSLEARLATFDYRWPFRQVRATPKDIAAAGFFFLGERDRVKCWYCNGGLQNWDPDDIPWREHAKWFPTCEFLLRMKGPEFAHQMILAFPNLRRPILRSPYDVAPIASLGMAPRRESRDISPPPPLIDPQKERIKMEQELHTALESAIAQRAVEMGFDIPAIQNVIRRQLANGGMMYTSVSPLIDDLTQYVPNSDDEDNSEPKAISPSGNSPQNKPEDETVTASQSVTMQVEPSATENVTPSMEERIRELQEERNCKICLDKAADVVFVPCGHLCCCVGCAGALRKCPICRVKIQKAIRTYMS